MQKTALLILTHFLDDSIIAMFRRLRAETSSAYDVFIGLNMGDKPLIKPQAAPDVTEALWLCNREKLLELGYPHKCDPAGWSGDGWKVIDNVDTILLSFYHDHPDYPFYWGIEYDVHYQGRWGFLFEHFEASRADLLGAMLDSAARTPGKILMPPFRDPSGREPDYQDAVVGFFPLHRLSRCMLQTLDAAYGSGWNGHYEFTWGTIAKQAGLEIEDFGGAGPYVKPRNINSFYFNTIKRWDMSPGTFVFRPSLTRILDRENTLWHPVKPDGQYNHCPALPDKTLTGMTKHWVKRVYYFLAIRLWFLLHWRPARTSSV